MKTGPKPQNEVRDEDVREARADKLSYGQIATKFGITRQRAYQICNPDAAAIQSLGVRDDLENEQADSHWERKLRTASETLLHAIIKLGLRRIYYPDPGDPDGIPDMPPDDIRARARELGLLR